MVLIDRRVEGVEADTVLVDNEHGAAEGVKHLIDGGYLPVISPVPFRTQVAAGTFSRQLANSPPCPSASMTW